MAVGIDRGQWRFSSEQFLYALIDPFDLMPFEEAPRNSRLVGDQHNWPSMDLGGCDQLSSSLAKPHFIRITEVMTVLNYNTITIQEQCRRWFAKGCDQVLTAFQIVTQLRSIKR